MSAAKRPPPKPPKPATPPAHITENREKIEKGSRRDDGGIRIPPKEPTVPPPVRVPPRTPPGSGGR